LNGLRASSLNSFSLIIVLNYNVDKKIHAMATKSDTTWIDDQKVEDAAEKTSHSSAELDAHNVVLDEAESARVLRKVDMRLVPMLSLLYLVAFIDRSNSTSITALLH
jgi:tRNA A58 N-methylase Trm61